VDVVETARSTVYFRRGQIRTCRLDSRTSRPKQHLGGKLGGSDRNRRRCATRRARCPAADAEGCHRQNRAPRRIAGNEHGRDERQRGGDLHSHALRVLRRDRNQMQRGARNHPGASSTHRLTASNGLLRLVLLAGARHVIRVVLLALRYRRIDVGTECPALEIHAGRENCFGATTILPDQATHVAQTV
jgi:hypothetical protein